jgi:hypothetical protein
MIIPITLDFSRGSRLMRRKRRQMQQMQQQESQQQQQLQPENEIYRQQQTLDVTDTDQFSFIDTADEPDAHPVPTLAGYYVAPAGQNSSPTASFPHSGPELGQLHQARIHNIPTGWPRQEIIAPRKESHNNEGHLLKLLRDKMQHMDSELNYLKDEHKQMSKTTNQIQCSIKRIREVREKNVFCWNCELYTDAVHYCESKGKWIDLDRFNRIITFAATENGATPTHHNDHCNDDYVISMPNRNEIIRVQKEEEAEKKRQAQATQELMLKRDAEEEKKQFQKQEDEELERKRQEGQRHATEMMMQNMRLTFYR